MEIAIDKNANIDSQLNNFAKSIDWQPLPGNVSKEFYKLRLTDGVFVLYFKSLAVFEVFNPVNFQFRVSTEGTFHKITGKVQFSKFLYLSIMFAAVVFSVMAFLGSEVDVMAVIFLLLFVPVTIINIRRLRNKTVTKSEIFFEQLSAGDRDVTIIPY